jgi:hypothetical protein
VNTLSESLERIVRTTSDSGEGLVSSEGYPALEVVLNRQFLSKNKKNEAAEAAVYSFLKQNAQSRVTSSHVKEFIKRLKTPRKTFTFRLAGRDWFVSEDLVRVKSSEGE